MTRTVASTVDQRYRNCMRPCDSFTASKFSDHVLVPSTESGIGVKREIFSRAFRTDLTTTGEDLIRVHQSMYVYEMRFIEIGKDEVTHIALQISASWLGGGKAQLATCQNGLHS